VHRLPDIANDCVSSVRVEVAANQAAAKPNSRLVSAGSKLPKSYNATRKTYFFNGIGQERRFERASATSGLPPEADICLRCNI
jgi:hypothetical protein